MSDDRGLPIPWKMWSQARRSLTATVHSNHLTIDFTFDGAPDSFLLERPLQSTLIADAVVRLEAVTDVLRPFAKQGEVIFLDRKTLAGELSKGNPSKMVSAVALIVAQRDRYMHGEIALGKNRHLSDFRATISATHSLRDIYIACLTVWIALYKACARAIRREEQRSKAIG
jgi:hypothetical protein